MPRYWGPQSEANKKNTSPLRHSHLHNFKSLVVPMDGVRSYRKKATATVKKRIFVCLMKRRLRSIRMTKLMRSAYFDAEKKRTPTFCSNRILFIWKKFRQWCSNDNTKKKQRQFSVTQITCRKKNKSQITFISIQSLSVCCWTIFFGSLTANRLQTSHTNEYTEFRVSFFSVSILFGNQTIIVD